MTDLWHNEDFEKRLKTMAPELAESYRTAKPFPHVVIDDFLPGEVAEAALGAFPRPNKAKWFEFSNERERKLSYDRVERLPDPLREPLYFLISPVVLQFLEELTRIPGLLVDVYFASGGLHQIERGGHLNVHADFNTFERFNLQRRINLIIYLNKDWKEEYGGHFEMWEPDMSRCAKKVLPVFNRCVIFSTTDDALHGHPEPLQCPPGETRKSLALYYYTVGRPEQEQSAPHTTIFRERPGNPIDTDRDPKRRAKKLITSFVPPIVTQTYRYLKRLR